MAPFVQVEPGLNSVCYGAWEGKTTDEVAALDPAGFDTFKNRIDRCVFENGETLDTLAARIRTTLLNLAEKYRGQQVVIGEWPATAPPNRAHFAAAFEHTWLHSPPHCSRSCSYLTRLPFPRTHLPPCTFAVTHQICTRAFLCDLVGAPKSFYWQLGQEPGCINVVEYDGFKFYLKIMNWTPDMWDKVCMEWSAATVLCLNGKA